MDAIRDELGGDYVVVADLDEQTAGYDEHVGDPTNGWNPIGSVEDPFTGTLQGDGHSIIGLRIDVPPDEVVELGGHIGLFAGVRDCTISNLSLEGVEISATGLVGTLGGFAAGSDVSNVSVRGSIEAPSETESFSGSILGIVNDSDEPENPTELRQLEANVDIDGFISGGICGSFFSDGLIEDVHTSGSISGHAVGGIVGQVQGDLESDDKSTIRRTSTSAGVNILPAFQNLELVGGGGLVGSCVNSTIDRCASTGSVSAVDIDEDRVEEEIGLGGVAGVLAGDSELVDSFSTASVRGTRDSDAGGLAGIAGEASIDTCYAAGEVSAGEPNGGLVPPSSLDTDLGDFEVTNSYWDVEATSQSSSIGVSDANGLSTGEMTGPEARDNLQGFDFDEVWTATEEYPVLVWKEDAIEPSDEDDDSYSLEEGVREEVTVDNTLYYVIRDIPETDSNQWAVTTPEFELVSPEEAFDPLLTHVFSRGVIHLNWESDREEANDRRQNMRNLEVLNRFLDLATGVLETYALFKVSPPSAVGSAAGLLQDSIAWRVREASDPYEQAFTEMTATCTSAATIDSQLEGIESVESFGEEAESLVSYATMGYEQLEMAGDYADAYAQVADSLGQSPGFTTRAGLALDASEQFIMSKTLEFAAAQLEGAFEVRARIAALFHAYDTTRLSLIDRLESKTQAADSWALTPGDGLQYHTLMASYDHMAAVTYAGASVHYEEMSNMASGVIWDVIDNADELAEQYDRISEFYHESAMQHYLAIGAAWTDAEQHVDDSINALEFGGDS